MGEKILIEIYFDDLNQDCQKKILEENGHDFVKKRNFDVYPMCIYEEEEEKC